MNLTRTLATCASSIGLVLLTLVPLRLLAQQNTEASPAGTPTTTAGQIVKGRVLDADSKYPITGAIAQVLGVTPQIVTQTDENGYFRLKNVPLGRQTIKISLMGYSEMALPNVLVTSGKEVVLEIRLEEKVSQKDAIEVV